MARIFWYLLRRDLLPVTVAPSIDEITLSSAAFQSTAKFGVAIWADIKLFKQRCKQAWTIENLPRLQIDFFRTQKLPIALRAVLRYSWLLD
jgi:hypothetical protein